MHHAPTSHTTTPFKGRSLSTPPDGKTVDVSQILFEARYEASLKPVFQSNTIMSLRGLHTRVQNSLYSIQTLKSRAPEADHIAIFLNTPIHLLHFWIKAKIL